MRREKLFAEAGKAESGDRTVENHRGPRPLETDGSHRRVGLPVTAGNRVDQPPYDLHRYWNYWMMTQRGGSLSYLTFGAGFSLLVYVLFYVLSDMLGFRVGVFRTFGTNALAAYVLAGMIGGAVQVFIPRDAPAWYAISAFCVDFFLIWLFVRTLEKNNIFLRV